MELLNTELRKQLPPLYATEGDADPMVICKFFPPWGNWSYYAIEFDGEDTFFGLVNGFEVELGYFSLSELASAIGPYGLTVERDLYFEPCRLSIIREQCHERR